MAGGLSKSRWCSCCSVLVALLLATIQQSHAQAGAQSAALAPESARPAFIEARLRFLGKELLPVTEAKRKAVVAGIKSVLGDEVPLLDVTVTPESTFETAVVPPVGRRLLQKEVTQGADFRLSIRTQPSRANDQIADLAAASRPPYELAQKVASQGFSVQRVIFQAVEVSAVSAAAQTPNSLPLAPGSSWRPVGLAPSTAPRKFLGAPAPAPEMDEPVEEAAKEKKELTTGEILAIFGTPPFFFSCIGYWYLRRKWYKYLEDYDDNPPFNHFGGYAPGRTWDPVFGPEPLTETQQAEQKAWVAYCAIRDRQKRARSIERLLGKGTLKPQAEKQDVVTQSPPEIEIQTMPSERA